MDRDCKNCRHKKSQGCELWECKYDKIDEPLDKLEVLQTIGLFFADKVKAGKDYDLIMECNRELLKRVREL